MKTADTNPPGEKEPADVTIILSTFNGSAFLQQQLNSLYEQAYIHIKIIARDDGSSDATRSILEREQSRGRLLLLPGQHNLGAAQSFFELLRHAAALKSGFVAFCDQDDVWLPEKISRAVSALSAIGHERAAMYCSRLEIVDGDLAHIGFTGLPKKVGFGNALVENICVGCTIVLNRRAIDLISRNLPPKLLVHDWWCYLVLSCFGEIIFDSEPRVKYRQHGNNTFGVARGHFDRLGRNLRRFAGRGQGRDWQSKQAAVFLATFGDSIPATRQRLVKRFVDAKAGVWQRLQLALSSDIWRQKKLDGLAWRFLLLINRF